MKIRNPNVKKLVIKSILSFIFVSWNIIVIGQTTCTWNGSGPWIPDFPPTLDGSTDDNTYVVQSGTCNINASGNLLDLTVNLGASCTISSGINLRAFNNIDIFGSLTNNSSNVTTEVLLVEAGGNLDNGKTTNSASISINTQFSIGGTISNAVNSLNYYMAFTTSTNARVIEIFNSKTISLKNLTYNYLGTKYIGQLLIRDNATFSLNATLNVTNLFMDGGTLIDSASFSTKYLTATNNNFITSPNSSTINISNRADINSGTTALTTNLNIAGKILQIDGASSSLQVNNATTTIGTLTLTNGGTYQSTASSASSLNITSVSSIDGHLTLNSNITVNTFPSSISVAGANSSIDYLSRAGLTMSVTGAGTALNYITARYLTFDAISSVTPATLGNSTLDSINLTSSAHVTLNNPVTVNKHAKIYTAGVLTSNGNLTISDGSALYFTQNSAVVGSVIMKRVLTYTGLTQFGSSLDIALTDFGSDWIGQYVESNDPGSTRWVKLTSGNLARGHGYERSTAAAREFSIVGRPNVNPVTIGLSYTTTNNTTWNGQRGFNLVSNPYTAPISVANFFSSNTSINQSIQLWDDNGNSTGTGDYIVVDALGLVTGGINPGHISSASKGYLAPQQAFFVKANTTAQSVYFNYSLVTESLNNNFLKSALAMDYIKLQVKSASGLSNEMVVRFIDGATDDFDNMYDAYKLKGNNNIALYSKLGKEDLIIQSLAPLVQDKNIKVGVRAIKDENYTFQIPDFGNFNSQYKVYLKDQVAGTITDLRTSNYTIRLSGDTIDSRFTLLFSLNELTSLKSTSDQSNIIVYPNQGHWYVNSDKEQVNANIQIYDIVGRLVFTDNIPHFTGNYEIKYNFQGSTIYILKIASNSSIYTKKILTQ